MAGLYMTLPDRALVLCVEEESHIQALDRSQPMLPLRPGQIERHTHDYTRHGTTSLFAALDVATGAIIGKCYPRHRASEFRDFLDRIEQAVPNDLDVRKRLTTSLLQSSASACRSLQRNAPNLRFRTLAAPIHNGDVRGPILNRGERHRSVF